MNLPDFIQWMPKVELHVHLFGAIEPETLLTLARRNAITLPADTVEGLKEWYTFTDFAHFVEIYRKMAECVRTADDLELIAREFLAGQAAQNIIYTELTYATYYMELKGVPFADQIAALNRAKAWAESECGISMNYIIDIPRDISVEEGMKVARQVVGAMQDGVVALGLGGPEIGNPPEKFTEAFAYVNSLGLPSIPHAGETEGAASVWGALRSLNAVRIGHGVRCLEDPALVAELRARQIPLEVNPSSNVCLHVVPDLEHHPFKRLMDEGLYVTLNSDDPAMFNTTLTEEYRRVSQTFGFDAAQLEKLVMNAARATMLPPAAKSRLVERLLTEFAELKTE